MSRFEMSASLAMPGLQARHHPGYPDSVIVDSTPNETSEVSFVLDQDASRDLLIDLVKIHAGDMLAVLFSCLDELQDADSPTLLVQGITAAHGAQS